MPRQHSPEEDADRLRQFKAEFFKALGHPLRIWILELLRDGPLSVTQIQEATGAPSSSVSQQLGVLRGRHILASERHGTTIIYRVPDPELFELLDVARRIFNAHLSGTIDMLRLVEVEAGGAGPNDPSLGSPAGRRRGTRAVPG
jgi:DNA-binding transcriptional ArsR family regulator